ncbi:hypothetical protein McaMca56_008125 [Microsporum canis]
MKNASLSTSYPTTSVTLPPSICQMVGADDGLNGLTIDDFQGQAIYSHSSRYPETLSLVEIQEKPYTLYDYLNPKPFTIRSGLLMMIPLFHSQRI